MRADVLIVEPGTTSRAMAVQARALELYRQLDLADVVVSGPAADGGVHIARDRRSAAAAGR